MMLETSSLWFVISKEYVELTRPKIESRDPIFFTGTRSRSRVSGNDRLFPRGSEFGPNLEIPAGPAIQLRPGPDYFCHKTPCGIRKLTAAFGSKIGVFSRFSWLLDFGAKMAEFSLPVIQIWQSRKRVAIQIQLMNIHVSECKYYCLHLVPKFGDMCDRQDRQLGAAANFGDNAINNNIYILTHEYSSNGFE